MHIYLLYYILNHETHDPEHPGRFRDYIDGWNMDFDLEYGPDDEHVQMAMRGMSRFDS